MTNDASDIEDDTTDTTPDDEQRENVKSLVKEAFSEWVTEQKAIRPKTKPKKNDVMSFLFGGS